MADWDRFSKEYDGIFMENPIYVDTIRKMVSEILEGHGKCILDLGCGTGNTLAEVLAEFQGVTAYGVDPSAGMRERCLRRFTDNRRVGILEGDALAIPLDDGQCDYVLTHLALHHVDPASREACANEIARVLKPGGVLVYADFFADVESDARDPERARDLINKTTGQALFCLDHGAFDMAMVLFDSLPATLRADGEYLTTVETWMEVLEAAGFEELSVTEVPPVELGVRIIRAGLTVA